MIDFKTAFNSHNVNVFYWPLCTGNKINTSYSIASELANFFTEMIKDVKCRPEITLKGYDKLLFKYKDKLYYLYAGDHLLYMQECFYCCSQKDYEKLQNKE